MDRPPVRPAASGRPSAFPAHAAPGAATGAGSGESIAERARTLVRKGALELQPLPALALRVMELLQHEDECDTSTLSRLTERDPALTARLLRAANASIYAGLRNVEDVQQAIVRIGFTQVRQLLGACVMKGAYAVVQGPRAELTDALWRHALATATGARHIARLSGGETGLEYLAGLMHDTGRLLVLRTVAEIEAHPSGPPITPALLDELMDELHCELGFTALTGWKFAEPVCRVARDHHLADPPDGNALLLCVQAANALSRRLGFHPRPSPDLRLLEIPAVERLALDDLQIATLAVDVEDEVRTALELI